MEVRLVLSGIRDSFYKKVMEKMKKVVRQEHICEMDCRKKFKTSDEELKCSENCKKAYLDQKNYIDSQFNERFKLTLQDLNQCDKNVECARQVLKNFKDDLDSLSNDLS